MSNRSPGQEPNSRDRKSGDEPFRNGGDHAGFFVREFWQWCSSDLLNNATRGKLAEFIVAKALGVSDGIRIEWDAFDLRTKADVSIEVKSCSYVQSWEQKRPSAISFVVKKTRLWRSETGRYDPEVKRQAKIYIFAVLANKDRETADPLKLEQWEFYPVLTSVLNARTRSQHSITLKSLQSLSRSVGYSGLVGAVHDLEQELNRSAVLG